MKPAYQRGRDDCFPAALASILELPVEVLPVAPAGATLEDAAQELCEKFLHGMGLGLAIFPGALPPAGWSVKLAFVELQREGKSDRFFHAFVALDGRVLHDPSRRSGRGDEEAAGWVVVYLLNPAPWVHREVRPIPYKGKVHELV